MILESKETLSFLLNQIGSNEHDERERLSHGLSAVLLGLCILFNENKVEGSSAHELTQLVQKRLGIDLFLDKIGDIPKHEGYIRALKSPQLKSASTSDLIFDHMFCELFRSVDRDITGVLSKRSHTPNTEAEAGDITQYKNFIREQDAKMNQFVEANNQLHAELTSVRALYEEAVGQIQILKDQSAIFQAAATTEFASPVIKQTETAGGNHADALKMEEYERQLRHKDEYIAELEARLVKDDGDLTEKLSTVVEYSQAQTIEIQNLKQQLESLRVIMMSKDEQILTLKNDLPIKPKAGAGPVDRFENMFMTSMELEAQRKKLTAAELEIKCGELERIRAENEKEIQALTQERNALEKELLDSKHRIDDLQEIAKDYNHQKYFTLEQELRDAQCKIEEFSQKKDSRSLEIQDSETLERMLRESELKLNQTTEQLKLSHEQLLKVASENEQLKVAKVESGVEALNVNDNNLKLKFENVEQQLQSLNSEQEDLLVMLSEQEETIRKYKTRLRELGENIASDIEDEENDDDLT